MTHSCTLLAGTKPAELYGKITWKIDKFSQISKRELRSDTFDAGNYKWCALLAITQANCSVECLQVSLPAVVRVAF